MLKKMRLFARQTNWLHVRFWFKKRTKEFSRQNDYGLSAIEMAKFIQLMRLIIVKSAPHIKRKFFLFEPDPHCFLALELKTREEYDYVKKTLENIIPYREKLSFIEKMSVALNTKDGKNGEGFLNILNATADYIFANDNVSISHIIHCMMDECRFNRKEESMFYSMMSKIYH